MKYNYSSTINKGNRFKSIYLLASLLILLLNSISLQSQTTYTFTGTGNWTNTANWDVPVPPGTTIDAGDEVIINGTCYLIESLENNGTITINNELYLTDVSFDGNYDVIITNNGTIESPGYFEIFDAVLNNLDIYNNSGDFVNNGNLYNGDSGSSTSGSFTNTGNVYNNFYIENSKGTIANSGGGAYIENSMQFGTLRNYDQITIDGNVINGNINGDPDAHIINESSGTITINASGVLTNGQSNFLTNDGTLNNNGILNNYHIFSNLGTFNNNADFNTSYEFNNGNVDQMISGTIINNGNFINNWNFNNYRGSLTNNNFYQDSDQVGYLGNGVGNLDVITNNGQMTIGSFVTFINDFGTVTNNEDGILNIYSDAYFASIGTVTNHGTVNIYGNLENNGSMNNTSTGYINNAGTGTLKNSATFTCVGSIDNNGFVENGDWNGFTATSGTFNINGSFTNYASLLAFTNTRGNIVIGTTGTLINYGLLMNEDKLDLIGQINNESGGNIYNSCGAYPSGYFKILSNGILLNKSGAAVINSNFCSLTNENTITNVGTMQNTGTLTNNNSYNNTGVMENGVDPFSGTFINNGTLNSSGITGYLANVAGTFTNSTSATLVIDNSFYNNMDGTLENQGIMKGSGTYDENGTLTQSSDASLRPGNSIGSMTVNGDFDLGSSTYDCEINATSNTTDLLDISGNADLSNSNLQIIWENEPVAVGTFTILACGSRTGTFAVENIPDVPGYGITINYLATSVEIVISVVLSIEADALNAKQVDQSVELVWKGDNQQIIRFFHVDRKSGNNQDWEEIETVGGQRDSYEDMDYNFVDHDPIEGVNYYRLRQEDEDGSFSFTNVVQVHYSSLAKDYMITPNPSDGQFVMSVGAFQSQKGHILISDQMGRSVHSEFLQIKKGDNRIPLDMREKVAGIYYLTLEFDNELIQERLMIKH